MYLEFFLGEGYFKDWGWGVYRFIFVNFDKFDFLGGIWIFIFIFFRFVFVEIINYIFMFDRI